MTVEGLKLNHIASSIGLWRGDKSSLGGTSAKSSDPELFTHAKSDQFSSTHCVVYTS